MRPIKKYLRIAEYVLAAVLIGVTIFCLIQYAQGVQPIYVISDNPSSMSPTINYGDAILVYRADFNSLKPNDIIVFRDPRGNPNVITHRIVAVNNSGTAPYVNTKGDNNKTNPVKDPWNLTSQHYNSKVILVIPYIGYLSPALWGISGPVFIVLGISAIVLIFAVRSLLKKPKLAPMEESA